ncbi:hypothetical protein FRC10_000535 [Ceratobasidium sp. 414]|nr:hypothetical protein FRC10_000535 [Ceratobasidium sp. 414]
MWLKEHNKKYYKDIIIDDGHLAALPVDGVPDVIKAGIQYETNESMVNDEYHGYVPESYFADHADIEVSSVEDNINKGNNNSLDVIPLQYLGVMDSDLSKVLSNKLMG